MLTELGFTLPADMDTVVPPADFGGNVSAENLDFADTDVLLWCADAADLTKAGG